MITYTEQMPNGTWVLHFWTPGFQLTFTRWTRVEVDQINRMATRSDRARIARGDA